MKQLVRIGDDCVPSGLDVAVVLFDELIEVSFVQSCEVVSVLF